MILTWWIFSFLLRRGAIKQQNQKNVKSFSVAFFRFKYPADTINFSVILMLYKNSYIFQIL